MLNAVLAFDKEELFSVEDEIQSSMKRIIKNIELGFQNIGIYKYNKKVEIKGLSNLFTLGQMFQQAIKRETELYTLSYFREDINSTHYGYTFEVKPNDGRKKSIWLSIAFWINEQEVFSIRARNVDNWAARLCKQIEEGEKFSSKYAEIPYLEDGSYYFDAKEKFYQEFNDAETFDAQVEIVSKLIDDVCLYYLK